MAASTFPSWKRTQKDPLARRVNICVHKKKSLYCSFSSTAAAAVLSDASADASAKAVAAVLRTRVFYKTFRWEKRRRTTPNFNCNVRATSSSSSQFSCPRRLETNWESVACHWLLDVFQRTGTSFLLLFHSHRRLLLLLLHQSGNFLIIILF